MNPVLRCCHVIKDRIRSFRIGANVCDTEVAPCCDGCRLILRVSVAAAYHIDRNPLRIRVGSIEGLHRTAGRVVPGYPAVGCAESAVCHLLITVSIGDDARIDDAVCVQFCYASQPLFAVIGGRSVDIGTVFQTKEVHTSVSIAASLDPWPESTVIVSITIPSVGVIHTVSVRIVEGKFVQAVFQLIQCSRNSQS